MPRLPFTLLVASVSLSLAACAASMQDRLQLLPATDRNAYDECALDRCGLAPAWYGEAQWAMERYEREAKAHSECWYRYIDAYVAQATPAARAQYLQGKCVAERMWISR